MTICAKQATLLIAAAVPAGAYVTTAALYGIGVSRRALSACIDAGLLLPSSRGLYQWTAASGSEPWQQAVRRSVARAGRDAVAALYTAARLQDMAGSPVVAPLWVTIPRDRSKPRLPGVDIMRSDVSAADRLVVAGVPTTAPLRTAVDCARFGERVAAVCIIESGARRGLFALDEVTDRLAELGQARGTRVGRAAVQSADLRSESPLETALRLLLLEAGLPYPEPQYPFAQESIWGRIDLAYPVAQIGGSANGRYVGLALEADGRSAHEMAATFHHDRVRHTALEEAGWLVRRFTDRAVRRSAPDVIGVVRRALAAVIVG